MKVFNKYYFLILAAFCGVLKADLNDFRSKLSQYQKDVNNTDLLTSLVDSYLMLNIQEIQRANQSLKQAGLDIVKLRQKSEQALSGRAKKLELQAQTKDKQRNKISADLSKAQDEIKALEKRLEEVKNPNQANFELEGAILDDDPELVKEILERGVDTNGGALNWVIRNSGSKNSIEIINLLLKYNANPNFRFYELSPIEEAQKLLSDEIYEKQGKIAWLKWKVIGLGADEKDPEINRLMEIVDLLGKNVPSEEEIARGSKKQVGPEYGL